MTSRTPVGVVVGFRDGMTVVRIPYDARIARRARRRRAWRRLLAALRDPRTRAVAAPVGVFAGGIVIGAFAPLPLVPSLAGAMVALAWLWATGAVR